MKITVDEDCIARGNPASGTRCPVALAMLKAGLSDPIVTKKNISYWPTGSPPMWIDTPHVAAVFICKLDEGLPVEPFEFEL